MKILLTGATGYVGGRLLPRLLEQGHNLRVLVRDRDRIEGREWVKEVEIYEGDLTKLETLEGLCDDIDVAYYLVHSMQSGGKYRQLDRKAARNFAKVGTELKKVIYLGGLQPSRTDASQHLISRAEVGKILRDHLPATEFRAGPIIGSGSASFEMVRYLTERIPVMVTPKWIKNQIQPIAIRDVLSYLLTALSKEPLGVVDIGTNRLTFRSMMLQLAKERQLKRVIISTPVLAPRLAARWVGLVTPISNKIAVPLVEGVIHSLVADTTKAEKYFPEIKPIRYRRAVQYALRKIEKGLVETRWSGALGEGPTYELVDREGLIQEKRTQYVDLPPSDVYKSFASIGGERGWLVWRWAWKVRGWLDQIVGGPGLRRGRRHPLDILPGEALDFWRVEKVEFPNILRLRAEMKVPGEAWLQWETVPEGTGTRLIQKAIFAPKGVLGVVYWYSLYPVHLFIFSDMVNAIARDARNLSVPSK